MKDCVADADVIVIATPWEEFKKIKTNDLKHGSKPILLDCWRMLNPLKYKHVAQYRAIGLERFKIANE